MNVIEQKIAQIEAEATALRVNNDETGYIRKMQEANQLRDELSRQAAVEQERQAVEETAQEIASSMETFRVGDMDFPLDVLAADADALAILRQGIAEKSQQQAQKWLNDLNVQKDAYESKLGALNVELVAANDALDKYQEENARLRLETVDLAEKRDAAVRDKEEAQAETKRLADRVSELEKQLASSPTQTDVVEIKSTADLAAAAQRLKERQEALAREKKEAEEAAKVRIYNVTPLDYTGAKFGAYRADNDEYLTYGYLEKNKYVELSPEEVQRFREEREEAKKAALESVPEVAVAVEPVSPPSMQFQEEEPTVPGHTTNSEMEAEPVGQVTRQEFKALVKRVEALEGNSVQEAA